MYKGKHITEPSFDDAIDDASCVRRNAGDVTKTTVHIPLWVRIAVSRVHVEKNVSEGKIYTALIDAGTQIIKIRYGQQIKTMEGMRYTLMEYDNELVCSLIGDFKICVNGVQGSKDRRTVRVVAWNVEYLGAVGAALRMEFSSMIRLALYLAFQSYLGLTAANVVLDNVAISTFERKLEEYSMVCACLTSDQQLELMSSTKEEEKTE